MGNEILLKELWSDGILKTNLGVSRPKVNYYLMIQLLPLYILIHNKMAVSIMVTRPNSQPSLSILILGVTGS